uniref:Uncharacterized protein n=1 Tax=Anguilla anguilla TaxID=7936 RepID=A0A0E9S4X6_ANGAN
MNITYEMNISIKMVAKGEIRSYEQNYCKNFRENFIDL